MAIWYNSWPFGNVVVICFIFFSIWYVWMKKNLATLDSTRRGLHFELVSVGIGFGLVLPQPTGCST
jgi:hypothetical protein